MLEQIHDNVSRIAHNRYLSLYVLSDLRRVDVYVHYSFTAFEYLTARRCPVRDSCADYYKKVGLLKGLFCAQMSVRADHSHGIRKPAVDGAVSHKSADDRYSCFLQKEVERGSCSRAEYASAGAHQGPLAFLNCAAGFFYLFPVSVENRLVSPDIYLSFA